ncbi:hypothetical protein FKW77_005806 [Venturia effusa]|uniref:MYND-type domain-containing protein n=1 Tax=Venturia effusa TaxID=50376 RepID=A0A517LCH5_9PEZI|nr:hypothetical protein FKW77_005806 [Venturia effusa]
MAGSCAYCAKSGTQHCATCKSITYCSKTCQKSDWKAHKHICKTFAHFDQSSRPSKSHHLAFLFRPDEDKPELVWLETERDEEDGAPTGPMLIQIDQRTKKVLDDFIQIRHRDTFLKDGSGLNTSIFKLAPNTYWRGPVVAVAQVGQELDPFQHRDVTLTDFRHVVDYLGGYASKTGMGPPKEHDKPEEFPNSATKKTVKGVKINCPGEQKIHGKAKYEAVNVLLSDPVFTKGDKSGISELIGLPVLTRKCRIDSASANVKIGGSSHGFCNQSATFMHLCCDANAKLNGANLGFGWAPRKWKEQVGTVLVVREDKKPILPFHVEAFADYCQYRARPYFGHAVGEYAPCQPMTPTEVLSAITKKMFYIYWYEADSKKTEELLKLQDSLKSEKEKTAFENREWKEFCDAGPPHEV